MTNIAHLVGRIARDPQPSTTFAGTLVVALTLVTGQQGRPKGRDPDIGAHDQEVEHNVLCFGEVAEKVMATARAGLFATVHGRLHYTREDDGRFTSAEVVATDVEVLANVGKR